MVGEKLIPRREADRDVREHDTDCHDHQRTSGGPGAAQCDSREHCGRRDLQQNQNPSPSWQLADKLDHLRAWAPKRAAGGPGLTASRDELETGQGADRLPEERVRRGRDVERDVRAVIRGAELPGELRATPDRNATARAVLKAHAESKRYNNHGSR